MFLILFFACLVSPRAPHAEDLQQRSTTDSLQHLNHLVYQLLSTLGHAQNFLVVGPSTVTQFSPITGPF
ncbi:hypothetical protein BKA66DRAFT_467408 [Pyrenochaeta sp. MPI-SDFR-AT-0127]|nr:hypothetical protein BKA66DRAFT_467408 [Pyrenochaeta sp. MPI-SDFR-AT-0127]